MVDCPSSNPDCPASNLFTNTVFASSACVRVEGFRPCAWGGEVNESEESKYVLLIDDFGDLDLVIRRRLL
jgi:hypothetical protein